VSEADDRAGDVSGAGDVDSTPTEATRERRAPVIATVLVAMALPLLMPERYTPGPRWLLPAVEAVFLVAAAAADPGRINRRSNDVRRLRIALIVILVFGAAWATTWLVIDLVGGDEITDADTLLASGSLVWIDVVIAFAFLYWELDGGGPGERAHQAARYPDLAFPQQLNPALAPPGWRPVFVDYLYLGFTDAIAFSPTDVMPLTHWAKLTMGLEAAASLVILGLVIARAVNILG
jgi:uncharacterized membrane protein